MYQKCIPTNILRNIAKILKVSNMGPVSPTSVTRNVRNRIEGLDLFLPLPSVVSDIPESYNSSLYDEFL